MKYKYQMHCHTSPCSKCAPITPQELIDSLAAGGYNGCVITNHFFCGNSGIERDLPWNDFVGEYEKNYLECKKIAQKHDIDVIFAIEEHLFDGLEILCYGITPQFLYDRPELRGNRSIEAWSNALREFGALCIQAHPFRDRNYINNPRLLPLEYIDGIEVFNACNNPEANVQAEKVAAEHPEWILTSGGDSHLPESACWGGIETNTRITNEKTLLNVLKTKDYELIL